MPDYEKTGSVLYWQESLMTPNKAASASQRLFELSRHRCSSPPQILQLFM